MAERKRLIYLLLGIGIGIIITNILNSAYPKKEYIELSDEKIIDKAEELGMVKIKENIELKKDEKNDNEKEENKLEKAENEKKDSKENKNNEILIEEGTKLSTVAKELYEQNLIDNEEEFIFFVRGKNLEKKINIGRYRIEDGSTYTEIIESITNRN